MSIPRFFLLLAATIPAVSPIQAWSQERTSALEYLDSGQWTFNLDCVARGDTVCTVLEYGVQIWNAADPEAPAMIGDFYLQDHSGCAVDWEGDLVGATTEDGRLFLLDVSDPAQPELAAELSGFGSNSEVRFVRDGAQRWAYLAGTAGLKILDVTDPSAVEARGTLALSGSPISVAALGDTLLVLAADYGLHAVDVSDPDHPALLDSEPLAGPLRNVSAEGSRAVVAVGDSDYGFVTFDVSDPADPIYRTQVIPNVGDGNGDLEVIDAVVRGEEVYLSTFETGLVVYDISDLASPSYLGHDAHGTYYALYELSLSGDRAYLGQWGHPFGVTIVDISDRTDPTFLGNTTAFDYVRFVSTDGGWVYGATGDDGVVAHEHVSPTNLVRRGRLPLEDTWGVFAAGGLAYIGSVISGLVIADFVSDPDNPQELGRLDVGWARGVEVHDGIAYIACFFEGFCTVNVANPAAPALLDLEYLSGMNSVNVSVQGDLAATADRSPGVHFWNVADPEDIVLRGTYDPSGNALDVRLAGEIAYVAVEFSGIHVVDVSDPENPVQVGSAVGGGSVTGCAVENGYLHVSRGMSGVSAFDLADPWHPAHRADYETTSTAKGICAAGSTVYVADHAALLALRFVEDTPVFISSFDLSWEDGAVIAEWEIATDEAAPQFRLRARRTAPESGAESLVPFEIIAPDRYRARDERGELSLGGTWLYTLDLRNAWGDWEIAGQNQLAISAGAPARPLILASHPNPFNPSTRLSFEMDRPARAIVEVFDLGGGKVATLFDGMLAPGPAGIPWDGKDSQGREVSGGVYLGRVRTGHETSSAKLVLLR